MLLYDDDFLVLADSVGSLNVEPTVTGIVDDSIGTNFEDELES